MENCFIIIENILSINKHLLKVNIISRLIIKILISLKMYKIEEDKLKQIFNKKKGNKINSIEYKKVYQMGYNIIILYVLIYDISIKNIIILILSVLDDFIELKKRKKLLISFLIICLLNKSYNKKILLITYEIIKGVFKINAINILSGINGIELFQLISFLLYYKKYELVSFLLPLFLYNKYPSKMFIGNGLLIYSSTKLLNNNKQFNIKNEFLEFIYWIPQLFNSFISMYQILFKDCPRHRMPRLFKSASTYFFQKLSYTPFLKEENRITYSSYDLYSKEANLTVLNLIIKYFSIQTEISLFKFFVCLQLLFFLIGTIISYCSLFY